MNVLSNVREYVLLDDNGGMGVNISPKDSNEEIKSYSKGFSLRLLMMFIGPGYLIAVGYMDPGNWATDIHAGAKFGYDLLSVILLSGITAMFLQYLCIRLGVVTGNDLAQQCRVYFRPSINMVLYCLAELAIIATDLAEVIGCAIALHLLFGLDLIAGVLITALDVLIVLRWWDKYQRVYEYIVSILVFVVGICFAIQLSFTKPSAAEVFWGLLPTSSILTNKEKLYVSCSIMGATVMPHNLYLHTALCQSKRIKYIPPDYIELQRLENDINEDDSEANDDETIQTSIKLTILYSVIDSCCALIIAIIINSMMLIVSASVFFKQGKHEIEEIEAAYYSLKSFVNTTAAVLFALALLASGQSSTITGTIAGQIVMSGFLQIKIRPWLRRVLTRFLAIAPAVLTILIVGEKGLSRLLIFSQVILSFQLPFAVIPLVIFSSSDKIMKAPGSSMSFVNSRFISTIAIFLGVLISLLNIYLLISLIIK